MAQPIHASGSGRRSRIGIARTATPEIHVGTRSIVDQPERHRVGERVDIENIGLRIERAALPVGAARGARQHQRPERRRPLAHHRRREDRAYLVARDQLYPLGAQLRREVDQIVNRHALPLEWRRLGDKRLRRCVPLAGDVSRSIVFEADGDHWSSTDSQLCTFMPLRGGGIGDDPRTVLALDADATVLLQTNQDQAIERAQVHEVLAEASRTVWSGVTFGKGQPLDPMWLWLATHLPNRLSRMPATRPAVDSSLVSPGLPWGDMAGVPVIERGLAYLTLRPVENQPGRHELGVIGHAKAGHVLAEQMAEQIAAWEPHRDEPLTFALHYSSVSAEETETQRVMARDRSSLVVAWGDSA